MRILITGSRTWTDRYSIMTAIERPTIDAFARGDTVLVIHGDAGGADRIARDLVRGWHADGWPIDEHAVPAKWRQCGPSCPRSHQLGRIRDRAPYCPTAGLRRNAEMVALGPDLALAFLRDCDDQACHRLRGFDGPHPSHGAAQCAGLAEAAGIPTVRVRWDDRDNPTADPDPN